MIYPYSRIVVMGLCPSGTVVAPLFGVGNSVSAMRMDSLCPWWRDKALGVNCWPTRLAFRERHPSALPAILHDTQCEIVIALGGEVQREIGVGTGAPYSWDSTVWRDWTIDVLRFPHPSGLNRHWNDPENKRRGAQALADALGR